MPCVSRYPMALCDTTLNLIAHQNKSGCIVGAIASDTGSMCVVTVSASRSSLACSVALRCRTRISTWGRYVKGGLAGIAAGSHWGTEFAVLLCKSLVTVDRVPGTVCSHSQATHCSFKKQSCCSQFTNLAVVASHAQLQHLIKALAPGEQPAQTPEGSPSQAAAAHPLILPITLNLEQGHS